MQREYYDHRSNLILLPGGAPEREKENRIPVVANTVDLDLMKMA